MATVLSNVTVVAPLQTHDHTFDPLAFFKQNDLKYNGSRFLGKVNSTGTKCFVNKITYCMYVFVSGLSEIHATNL